MGNERNIESEIYDLADLCLHGDASDAQEVRLEHLIHSSKEAWEFYIRYISDATDLQYWADAQDRVRSKKTEEASIDELIDWIKNKEKNQSPVLGFLNNKFAQLGHFMTRQTPLSITLALLIMISVIITLSFLTINIGGNSDSVATKKEWNDQSIPEIVATVVDFKSCRWPQGAYPRGVDDKLLEGEQLELLSGLIEIQFNNGAKALIHGPAKIKFQSAKSVNLLAGKSTFYVPSSASGFYVDTRAARIVDIGTEFIVSVDDEDITTTGVYVGKVEVWKTDSRGSFNEEDKRDLTANQFIQIKPSGEIKKATSADAEGVRVTEFRKLKSNYNVWLNNSKQLRKDKDLIAYYTFERSEQSPATLTNSSSKGTAHDGVILDGKWESGRFPEKKALGFYRDSSRVKVDIPTKLRQITVASWVRFDKDFLGKEPKSILTSDGWTLNGELSVHIGKGKLQSSVSRTKNLEMKQHRLMADMSSMKNGQWTFVAMTYDANSSKVIYYINGQKAGSRNLPEKPVVNIGSASIGNFIKGKEPRPLGSAIDELMIFSRSLSANEINNIYQLTKP